MGEYGAHLKLVERVFGVTVSQRGDLLMIGEGARATDALDALEQLLELVRAGKQLHRSDVEQAVRMLERDPDTDLGGLVQHTVLVKANGHSITPRTPGQAHYVRVLQGHDVVFGVGPAGTGKTYLAVATAVQALQAGQVKRLVLTRPAVEAGEKLGFLPGDLTEKVDPYLRPLYDALYEMLSPERTIRMLEKQIIEVAPLAFMRGRTLADAYVLLDEAQNTTVEQMKMFLTRLGNRGRMVITGDDTQVDLQRGQRSGLAHALHVLGDVPAVGVARMTATDVVRHPLVGAIVEAYERDATREAGEAAAELRAKGPRGRR